MPISDGSKAYLETIGLVAYYSNDPVELNTAEALAVMEHLIFMTCRQYEGFKLRNQIGERLGTLEIQRIFARLLAHEATKPLAGIKDFMDSVEEATRQSRESLGKFARGEIEALQRKRRVDLFEIMAGVKRLRATRMDGLHVRYEEDISPGTYIFGDRDAVKYSLGVLLDNAIDHGDGHVRVWTKGKSNGRERKRHIVVCVANNGAPMAPRLEEAIKAGQPPLRAVKRRANQGVGLHLAFEFARLNKWKLQYQRFGDDPRELLHVFELWLPKAPTSE
jgi:signal transduction histidine kinase